jgi:hypothetical protein
MVVGRHVGRFRKTFPGVWRNYILLSLLAAALGTVWTISPPDIPSSLAYLAPFKFELAIGLMVSGYAGVLCNIIPGKIAFYFLVGALYLQWIIYAVEAVASIQIAYDFGPRIGLAGAIGSSVIALLALNAAVSVTQMKRQAFL